ncbi:MAG: LamG domain-containing protein [Polyangiaceae bacterium]|nr:LamG domain-containing protein [Polyangiaceae bacterium]
MSQFSRTGRVLLLSLLPVTACRWSDSLLTVRDRGGTDGGTGGGATGGTGGEAGGGAGAEAGSAACRGSVCVDHVGTDAGNGLTEGLVVWYRCESTAGSSDTVLPDSTTHGNDGILVTGAAGAPAYSFAAGTVGNALELSYANEGYVAMPAGLLADACEATIATWVYINSNVNAWTRIWDFGQDTNRYMFLTPITNTDDLARFGISICGNTQEEVITGQAPILTLAWTHVAVVLGPSGGTLYVDGAPVGTNSSMTLRPADLGSTPYSYIGRSQFSDDPYLDADIDDFRVYDRALSPEEIQTLASGS